jgi:3-hydroxyisobutyrate dehydrogenase
MARNLAKAGHQVAVFDIVPAALEAASARRPSSCASAADAARGAEVVVTMLPPGSTSARPGSAKAGWPPPATPAPS